ncbi:unnamed protein product [Rotaria sp. Silwood2]|nr:unnamed protein product [Rotaria sp. Silwood2]CAF3080023.1 unnamed protein product [Rotaria sp. Silwood2]CAF4319838.1 unnamed protein product [Rotaria sp. Silwood2]CAF4373837.1 unnamed protein product [Rotaria sp. Silwood2]
MKLLVIILSFILFSHIYGLNTDESTGINVLEILKAKNLSCDLHIFINSTDNSQDEYNAFINDLTQYCSNSESTKPYRVLCRMILIELEIGCLFLNNTNPLPVKYITSYTPNKICSTNKILYINRWIWDKLKSYEKKQIGTASMELCFTITSFNETLRLVKFFYKIAPRIREIDTYDIKSLSHQIIADSSANKVRLVKKKHFKKTNNTIGIPLGRGEELSGRVQVNERPKPKALDIEVVFKSNDGEKRNWIEGRDGENKEDNEPRLNLLRYNRTKSQENRLIIPSVPKKKPKFKPRLNVYREDDDNWSDNAMTIFLVFTLCIIIIYLILSNKNKILGLIIEGCRLQRVMHGRRFGSSFSMKRLTRPTQSI